MLVKSFHVSLNTQMLGIKYAYLMIYIFLTKIVLNLFKILKIKKLKFDYEEEIEEKYLEKEKR